MWTLVKILAAVAVYGTVIEPRFVLTEHEPASIPSLPATWEGKQVAVFADLQVGMWWANRDAARKVVRKVVELKPAVTLIAGDFVYDADMSVNSQMHEVLDILQPILDAKLPTYAVLGNHDYELMNEHSQQENHVAQRVRFTLDSAGIRMLDNKAIALYPAGADSTTANALWLVGVGEKWAKNDHPDSALARLPVGAPRLVFMHDPDSFAHIPAEAAPVAVAAHTHGMQLGIPFVSDWMWRTYFSDEGSGVAGWIDGFGKPGNHLYINRGIGFSVLPARVGAPPELTVFTLSRAPQPQP
ncbi:MAG: metallophosphoesterase [Gemmatimonadaceae bacterium]